MNEQHDHGFFDDRCSVCVAHIDEPVLSREQTQQQIEEVLLDRDLMTELLDVYLAGQESHYSSRGKSLFDDVSKEFSSAAAERIVSLLWGEQ